MSNYFSNHSSQSRFLAISSASNVATTSPSVAPSSSQASATSTNSHSQIPGRARSTSKHFSTSVEAHGDVRKGEDEVDGTPLISVHPLRNTHFRVVCVLFDQSFFCMVLLSQLGILVPPAARAGEQDHQLRRGHQARRGLQQRRILLVPPHAPRAAPSLLTPTTDYLLFHAGIARPVWEDPLNITGGKWIIRLRKGVADRVWEALLCAVVGDLFAGCRDALPESWEDDDPSDGEGKGKGEDGKGGEESDAPEICGCTISVRQSEDIISLWNRVDQDVRVRERIRDTLRQVLNIPASTVMEYKSNNDSMQDKSSFRNSAIDRTPLA
ncbi:Eukaryotic translation initiation factor 4E type 2 [Mycena venus]|uniref:Eukaryotic translation initiation factor 4E type 2 n=1 Tax=Mycena venus TaxID=2733690 RepID=A0A8H6XS50_9AGAR|nr:Eukaryotic translation initiation factor 4E type 2 [Mycena venus]